MCRDIRPLLAGAGIRRGTVLGETDDFSYTFSCNNVSDPVHVHDLHATLLHLLGIDHELLDFQYQGPTTASPTCTAKSCARSWRRDPRPRDAEFRAGSTRRDPADKKNGPCEPKFEGPSGQLWAWLRRLAA